VGRERVNDRGDTIKMLWALEGQRIYLVFLTIITKLMLEVEF